MPGIGRTIALIGFIAAAFLRPALAEPPKFQVDPTWPQALPNNWIIGTIGGIFVDAQDHIWINQRPSSLDAREKRAQAAEEPRQRCDQTFGNNVRIHLVGERSDALHRHGFQDVPHHLPNRPCHRFRGCRSAQFEVIEEAALLEHQTS